MKSILFVCFGNLCRSPATEIVFKHKLKERGLSEKFIVSSAGVSDQHTGQTTDFRVMQEAQKRGITDTHDNPARKITLDDYYNYDLILAMEMEQLLELQKEKPADAKCEIDLLLSYVDTPGDCNILDPYYETESNFPELFDILDDALEFLIIKLTK